MCHEPAHVSDVSTSCLQACCDRIEKENTLLPSVIQEKLMVGLSFPLAYANVKGGRGGGGEVGEAVTPM